MTLKQFLKPDWRKIGLFIIFAFLSPLSFIYGTCLGARCFIFPWTTLHIILNFFMALWFLGALVIVIMGLYWYLLSCLIVWIYDKVKKK
jgi:hypothetical protein